jgi:glycerol-3-phosphate dehydrogenase
MAALAGVDVSMRPSPGVLLALRGRLCHMIVNRMHKSADGDIIVPQRGLSIVGTTSWVVEDPTPARSPPTMSRACTRRAPS